MDRRKFLNRLGLSATAVLVAPTLLVSSPSVDVELLGNPVIQRTAYTVAGSSLTEINWIGNMWYTNEGRITRELFQDKMEQLLFIHRDKKLTDVL